MEEFIMRTKTLLTNASFAKLGEVFTSVSLPHTWNNLDGQDGGADYWRGIGIYNIALPNPTAGKKQYIELNGANHVATVYCNGRELGTHRGALSMVSTLEATRDMMGTMSFRGLSAFMDAVPERNWAQANRLLNKIKK